MDFAFVIKFLNIIVREAWRRKYLCLFGFALVSFAILIFGSQWPSKFNTSVTIYADNQNILKPLLQNQAAQSSLQNQTRVVRDMLHSPRILKRVVDKVYNISAFGTSEELAQKIGALRSRLVVSSLASGYIKISYSDSTSDAAYRIINAVVDVFISASAEEQRSESREAYLFIDNQVKQYKDQLVLAEQRLKEFRGLNFDGRDGDVHSSIRKLRDQIEQLKISIDEDRTTVVALEKQLADESEYSSKKHKANVYSERLQALENKMSSLLLSYTEDYPDVVSLKYQIEDIKRLMSESYSAQEGVEQDKDDAVLNPLYQEIRSRLSKVKTSIQAKEKRLSALGSLLDKEFERRKRIAERGAEESELLRDYDVTRRIYEDMLERKEKARLSMTLNVEGQGVTYRIQQPALPPLAPEGLRFLHFFLVGPFAGFLVVFGLLVSYVLMDRRIRLPENLYGMDVQLLAVVPHVSTPITRRVFRVDIIICCVLLLGVMAAYVGLAFASKIGLI